MMTIMLLLQFSFLCSQTMEDDQEFNASQIEELSEMDDVITEDDYDRQQLAHFRKHPLNINGPQDALAEFSLLDPLLLSNLSQYRKVLGDLLSIYELQAVPGFTVAIIKRLLPYLTVKDDHIKFTSFQERLFGGEQTALIRPFYIPEKAKGFSPADSQEIFTGSRLALLFRYKYQYRQLLQYGFVGEKDAGENFFLILIVSYQIFIRFIFSSGDGEG